MGALKILPPGRAFEMEIFGITEDVERAFRRPSRRDIDSSIQNIIEYNLAMYAEALERGSEYCHNPAKPEMGKTNLLWQAVKQYLPSRTERGNKTPLNLYVAIGRTSLDWQHGVDAFFWWQGVYVTIDASLRMKQGPELKADFVLNPKDLEPQNLSVWGKQVAELLIERKKISDEFESV